MEFKNGKYPVLSQSAQDTEEIYFQQYNQVQKVETDHQMQEHLLAVYQSELKSLTIEQEEGISDGNDPVPYKEPV